MLLFSTDAGFHYAGDGKVLQPHFQPTLLIYEENAPPPRPWERGKIENNTLLLSVDFGRGGGNVTQWGGDTIRYFTLSLSLHW